MPGICPKCHDNVYAAEEVYIRGYFWHKSCFRCSQCRKRLDNNSDHHYISDEVFCIICFKKFGDQENRKRLYSDNTELSDQSSVYSTPLIPAEARSSRSRLRENVKPRSKSAGRILDNPNFRFIKSIEERNLTASANLILKQNVYKPAGKPEGRAPKNHFYSDSVNSDKDFPIAKDKFLKSREVSPASNNHFYGDKDKFLISREVSPVSTRREQWLIKDPQPVLRRAFNFPGRGSREASAVFKDLNDNNPKRITWTSVQASVRETRFSRKLEICNKCKKQVYQAEMCKGAGGVWHKYCFLCDICGRRLDSSRLCERGDKIFCNSCYHKNFGPRGIGYGIGANFQT